MMGSSKVARSDTELLSVVEVVLKGQAFSVEKIEQTMDLLLAENEYFIVAVVASHTIQDLRDSQGFAEGILAARLDAEALGPKKWDVYLVLLTQEVAAEDDTITRELYAINYDTTRLRRVAHTGVSATQESVSRALAPFIAPVQTRGGAIHKEPMDSLFAALNERGVDPDLASRAIAAFEQGAALDDVL
jgi:hypothetical protein